MIFVVFFFKITFPFNVLPNARYPAILVNNNSTNATPNDMCATPFHRRGVASFSDA